MKGLPPPQPPRSTKLATDSTSCRMLNIFAAKEISHNAKIEKRRKGIGAKQRSSEPAWLLEGCRGGSRCVGGNPFDCSSGTRPSGASSSAGYSAAKRSFSRRRNQPATTASRRLHDGPARIGLYVRRDQ